MGFLNYDDIVFNYNFQEVSSSVGLFERLMWATAPGPNGNNGFIWLRSGIAVGDNFIDTDRGYRDSYGRYYKMEPATNKMWTTASNAGQIAVWEKPSFTYGFVFRDTSTSDAERFFLSKPATNASSFPTAGVEISVNSLIPADQGFRWRCDSNIVGNYEEVILNSGNGFTLEINAWYIGYVIKADGVLSKVGVKKKSESSWITETGSGTGAPITVDYDSAKNAALFGLVNPATGALQDPFWGNVQRFCMWDVAIAEADVQAGLEDHFGQADRPAGPMTLGGGMGGTIRKKVRRDYE
jgi:hypothetical protein